MEFKVNDIRKLQVHILLKNFFIKKVKNNTRIYIELINDIRIKSNNKKLINQFLY